MPSTLQVAAVCATSLQRLVGQEYCQYSALSVTQQRPYRKLCRMNSWLVISAEEYSCRVRNADISVQQQKDTAGPSMQQLLLSRLLTANCHSLVRPALSD
jgi:hypothetical protein